MPGSGKMADGKLDSYRSVKCELWVNISSILWCNDKRLSSRVPARLDSADPVVNWPLGKEGLGCSGAAPPDGSYTENCSLGVCTRLSPGPSPPHSPRELVLRGSYLTTASRAIARKCSVSSGEEICFGANCGWGSVKVGLRGVPRRLGIREGAHRGSALSASCPEALAGLRKGELRWWGAPTIGSCNGPEYTSTKPRVSALDTCDKRDKSECSNVVSHGDDTRAARASAAHSCTNCSAYRRRVPCCTVTHCRIEEVGPARPPFPLYPPLRGRRSGDSEDSESPATSARGRPPIYGLPGSAVEGAAGPVPPPPPAKETLREGIPLRKRCASYEVAASLPPAAPRADPWPPPPCWGSEPAAYPRNFCFN